MGVLTTQRLIAMLDVLTPKSKWKKQEGHRLTTRSYPVSGYSVLLAKSFGVWTENFLDLQLALSTGKCKCSLPTGDARLANHLFTISPQLDISGYMAPQD